MRNEELPLTRPSFISEFGIRNSESRFSSHPLPISTTGGWKRLSVSTENVEKFIRVAK